MGYNIRGIHIKSKNDYQKFRRKVVTTSIREDLYRDFEELCNELNQPKTKAFDILLTMLKDSENLQVFVDKLQTY